MARLSDIGIPGIGVGIIQPNLPNRFSVRFLDLDGYELDSSKQLGMQVTAVRDIIEGDSDKTFTMIFQDDIVNRASKGIMELQEQSAFVVELNQLDGGDTVLRQTDVVGVKVSSVQYTDLDYAGITTHPTLQFMVDVPERLGMLRDMIEENPVGAAIVHALSGAHLRVSGYPGESKSHASEIRVRCTYTNIDRMFK